MRNWEAMLLLALCVLIVGVYLGWNVSGNIARTQEAKAYVKVETEREKTERWEAWVLGLTTIASHALDVGTIALVLIGAVLAVTVGNAIGYYWRR